VIALSSMAGKNFLARLGAELDVSPITDVVSVVSTHAPHCTIDACQTLILSMLQMCTLL
jgi:electron transfer flavoprotein alpha subunit